MYSIGYLKCNTPESEGSKLMIWLQTYESELKLDVKSTILGEGLLHLVCQTVGVCETWYFGFLYENKEGLYVWLKSDDSLGNQKNRINFKKPFLFVIKPFPENISELTFSRTVDIFFLQMKQAILSMNILCPAEVCVLLASYALQAEYGDFKSTSKQLNLCLTNLLPENVIKSYNMTSKMWEDLIIHWYTKHRSMKPGIAKLEYLKVVETLEMYGIHYFSVHKKENKEENYWLGLSSRGVNIYDKLNMLQPIYTFNFSEVEEVKCENGNIEIKIFSENDLWLVAEEIIVAQIKEVYEGNCKLFIRRHKLQESLGERIFSKISVGKTFCKNTSDHESFTLSAYRLEKDWRHIEYINQILNERCNAVEEEAIMLCGVITKLMLQQSRHMIYSCLPQIL